MLCGGTRSINPDMGPEGYSKEHLVEKWFRDIKVYDIFEGTEQIQQLVISRAISGLRIE